MDSKAITKVQAIIVAVVIVVAAVAGVAYYTIALTKPAPESIKVGLVAHLTGGWSAGGIRQYLMVKATIDKINEEGGVYVKEYGKKIPLKLIYYDAESDPAKATNLATKLIVEDGVLFITSSAPPPLSFPVAEVAERYGAIMIFQTMLEDFIVYGQQRAGGYWKWSWQIASYIQDAANAAAEVLKMFGERTNKKIAMIQVDDVVGHTHTAIYSPIFEKMGYTIVFKDLLPPGILDFTSVITKIKSEGAEIVFTSVEPLQFGTFWRQCSMMGYKPKMVFGTRYCDAPKDAEAIGGTSPPLAHGLMINMFWWNTYPFPGNEEIRELWSKTTDLDMHMTLGYQYTIIQVMKRAVEIAGTLDKEAVNEAVGKVEMVAPVGPIKIDPQTRSAHGIVTYGQIVYKDGKYDYNIIWAPPGSGIKVTEAIFPIP